MIQGSSTHSSPYYDALTFAKTKVSSLAGDRGIAKKKLHLYDLKPKGLRENK
jgi:hypothetical protein